MALVVARFLCVEIANSPMCRAFIAPATLHRPSRQHGAALLAFVLILTLGGVFFLVQSLNKASTTYAADKDKETQQSLRDAKAALLGYIAREAADTSISNPPGQFPCPEDASKIATSLEGTAQTSCTSSSPTIGRLPWYSIKAGDLRDGWGEKLWYVLSPGFRVSPINSTIAGQLSLDGKAVVALIISPGTAINAQSRPVVTTAQTSTYFGTAAVYQQFLDGENATSPADFNFTSTGTSASFNDRVIAITAQEVFDIIEPIVASRISNSASADSLYTELGSYATAWGSSTYTYPFAATFANPSTAGYTQFRGVMNTYQGLIPASSSTNDPTFITWSTAITVTKTGGNGSVSSSNCTTSGTSPVLTLTCTITYRRTGSTTNPANTPVVSISLTMNNVGKAFKSPIDTSSITYTWGPATGPFSPASQSAPGNPTQTLNASGNLIVSWTGLQLHTYTGSSPSNARTLTIKIIPPAAVNGILSDHSILLHWFFKNEWYRATYYAVASQYAPPMPHTTCGACVTVNSVTGKKVVMILMGRAMSGQSQPSSSAADYLEGTNRTAATTPTLVFSQTPRSATNTTANDLTVVVQ